MSDFKDGDTVYHWHRMDLESSTFIHKLTMVSQPYAMLKNKNEFKFLVPINNIYRTKQDAVVAMSEKLREEASQLINEVKEFMKQNYSSIPKRPCEDFYPDW